MVLPQLKDFDFQKKRVLIRCDFDVSIENGKVVDDNRLRDCLPTIKYLLDQSVDKIVLMGHTGRPEGKVVKEFSLAPVAQKLNELLSSKFKAMPAGRQVQSSKLQCKVKNFGAYKITENIILLENLRFDPREENNDEGFAKELAGLGDFYVNEAFATSHREHASIVGVPKYLPHCAGIHFASEVENLSKVLKSPRRPIVFVIGGAKPETKLPLLVDFAKIADWVLIGGILVKSEELKAKSQNLKLKTIIADLVEGGLDINEESIKKFVEIIKSAGTVVWNGPMGKYEGKEGQEGTRRVGEAIANSTAFKVVGGGDTISALTKFGLLDKMDYVSTGGGAMLGYLAKGNLPGIEILNR